MQPLLTIAIPTYNRADILRQTIERLTKDEAFDPAKIELLVSDNASTDHTADVVALFPAVIYHRNSRNIGFENFTVAMSLAQGRYVRLMNDTVSFKPGMLGFMLKTIEHSDPNSCNLLFVNSLPFAGDDLTLEISGKKELLGIMSYLITWVANFGAWREDYLKIGDPDRCVDTLMQHVDWFLRIAENGKPTTIVVNNFLDVQSIKNKGRYNLFDTFINKYLSILRLNDIRRKAIEIEKYRLLRYFVIPWYFRVKQDQAYSFALTNSAAIIYRNYWYEPYFYPLMGFKYLQYLVCRKR